MSLVGSRHHKALVTGASSGIGEAVSSALRECGVHVIGVSRQAQRTDRLLSWLTCDLSDRESVDGMLNTIASWPEEQRPSLVIHCAGVGHFAPHEELGTAKLDEILDLNLRAPLLITRALLRDLKRTQGDIVFISSTSGLTPSRLSAAYGASKAALRHFSLALFEEVRKFGIRTICISPDMTRTSFHDHCFFGPDLDPRAALTPKTVATTVIAALQQPPEVAIPELVVKPQIVRIAKRRQEAKTSSGVKETRS